MELFMKELDELSPSPGPTAEQTQAIFRRQALGRSRSRTLTHGSVLVKILVTFLTLWSVERLIQSLVAWAELRVMVFDTPPELCPEQCSADYIRYYYHSKISRLSTDPLVDIDPPIIISH